MKLPDYAKALLHQLYNSLAVVEDWQATTSGTANRKRFNHS
ncbi:hypothetical protein [Argonema antarcticum]|nr:hypothetical protein [Argonema antarcticum]